MIYLDCQATTPVAPYVRSAMEPYVAELFANPHSSQHALGWRAMAAVETAAASVGRLVGVDPDEVIFTSGATESNNLALLGFARRNRHDKRNRVLLSRIEHKSVLSCGRELARQFELEVDLVPVDHEGRVDMSAYERLVGDDVLLISIMAVNNEIGTIQDISQISRVARLHGAALHCDGAQAPLAVDDLTKLGSHVDLLSLSSHKMYGPKGIGALVVKRDIQRAIEPLFYGGGQQNGLRPGTLPVPLCVGMGAAADFMASEEAQRARMNLRRHRDCFVSALLDLPYDIQLNGPRTTYRHPGNAHMYFPGCDGGELLGALQPEIAASTGSACSSGIPEPSHVLTGIGLSSLRAEQSVRFGLGVETTQSEIAQAVDHISNAIGRVRDSGM